MQKCWLLCACLFALAACPAPRLVTPTTSSGAGLPSLSLSARQKSNLDRSAGEKAMLLQWRGSFPESMKGKLFVLIERTGYIGTAIVRGASTLSCDDCPGPLVEAEVTDGQICSSCTAFGPVASPLPKARWTRFSGFDTEGERWQVLESIDLDGDGKWDLEQVSRCGDKTASGCNKRVCNKLCTGMQRTGQAEPMADTVVCSSFVPDVEDCKPAVK